MTKEYSCSLIFNQNKTKDVFPVTALIKAILETDNDEENDELSILEKIFLSEGKHKKIYHYFMYNTVMGQLSTLFICYHYERNVWKQQIHYVLTKTSFAIRQIQKFLVFYNKATKNRYLNAISIFLKRFGHILINNFYIIKYLYKCNSNACLRVKFPTTFLNNRLMLS